MAQLGAPKSGEDRQVSQDECAATASAARGVAGGTEQVQEMNMGKKFSPFMTFRMTVTPISLLILPLFIALEIGLRILEPFLNNPFSISAWVGRVGILLQLAGVISVLPQAIGESRTLQVQRALEDFRGQIQKGRYSKAFRYIMFFVGCIVAVYAFLVFLDAALWFRVTVCSVLLIAYVFPELQDILIGIASWALSWTKLELPRLLATISLPLLSIGAILQFVSTFMK